MAENPKSGRTALSELLAVNCIALDAAPVGTTDDSVLRWLAAGVTIVGTTAAYITAPDSAASGTIFTFRTPGVYRAEMGLVQLASTTILAGISKGGTTGAFTGNPALGANGVIAVIGPNTLPAATTIGLYAGIEFEILEADLGSALAQVRFLCTDGSGATPIAALTEAGCWARITRICDKAA